jgi:hypothetical protein
MMAPKLSLFLVELNRRGFYLIAIVFVLSWGGPEVPADRPQAMEWRFEEPEPNWKPVTPGDPTVAPAEVPRSGDGFRVTLTDQMRTRDGNPAGGVFVDLPDLTSAEGADGVIRSRGKLGTSQ